MADTLTETQVSAKPVGQRELQRLETRRNLAEHAVRLYLAQGYDNTTIEEITAAAGVSTRTFFLHFRTKAEAAFPDHDDRAAAFIRVLYEGSPHAKPVGHLIRVLIAGVRADTPTRLARYRLLETTPELRAEDARTDRDYEAIVRDYLLHHWGDSPEARLRATVAGNTVVAAVRGVLVTAYDCNIDPVEATTEVLYRMFGSPFSRPIA